MKQKTKYRTLKPTDSVCVGDAFYVDGKPIIRFDYSNHIPALCYIGVVGNLSRIYGKAIEIRRKRKQRNKTKARWL